MTLRDYIQHIAAKARYHFTSTEAIAALGITQKALNMSLIRLRKKRLIASPAKQFHILLPPEYIKLGCLPPDQFIPHLMQYWKLPYYVCLLSAAEYFGATHQKSQYFQIMTIKKKPTLQCGGVKVRFIKKSNIKQTPCQTFNTLRSVITVSTPEATAIDLVTYPWQAGGLNHVATVLAELGEKMDKQSIANLVKKHKQTAAFQRLGYLLTILGFEHLTTPLKEEVEKRKPRFVPLNSDLSLTGYPRDYLWRIGINMKIESDEI